MSRAVDRSLSRQSDARRRRRGRNAAPWRAPLRRARRRIDATLGRVETTAVVIDATVRLAAGRPLETSRRLHRLQQWIGEAGARLQRALHSVEETTSLVAREPHRAAEAPLLLFDVTERWIDAAARLNEISTRLVETSARLLDDARSRGFAAGSTVVRTQTVRVRTTPTRHAPVVLIRRRWFIVAFSAEVARKICRGRAPPSDSSALSDHRS